MKNIKHTPGPWSFPAATIMVDNLGNEDPSIGHHTYIKTPSHLRIDVWGHGGMTKDETELNAKLIAKAPELLDLLKDLVKQGGGGNAEGYAEVSASTLDDAQALINEIESE